MAIEKKIDFAQGVLDTGNIFCFINLCRSDVSKVRINYDIFRLYFPPGTSDGDKCAVYERVLNNFMDDGLTESYKTLDIEYRKYKAARDGKWFTDWLQEWWWNYGYNKSKIFRNSFILLFFFFGCNILISLIKGPGYLMNDVYHVDRLWDEVEARKLKYVSKFKFFISYLPYLFIYTAMIFFVVNLNIKFIRYSSKIGLAYILSIFATGLACVAYIINFVLDK